MFTFLLVLHALIAAALVAVILMQRSEGGGLGTGGGPAGLMTARGAADFLTRTTAVLAVMFVGMSIVLAAVAGVSRSPGAIDTTFAREAKPMAPVTGGTPASSLPLPLGGLPGVPAPGAPGVPAPETTTSALPSTDGTARSNRDRKSDGSESSSSTSSSKKKRSESDGDRSSRSSASASAPSSSTPVPIQLREPPKVGTLAPSQPSTGGSSPATSSSAPAPTPKASSTPVAAPTAPVTTGNGQ